MVDGVGAAIVKVLGELGSIEEAIQVRDVIRNDDLAVSAKVPFEVIKERAREGLECLVVRVPLTQDCRRNREDHVGRRELSSCEDMVDEKAVDPSISILKRVNEHKAKGDECSRD